MESVFAFIRALIASMLIVITGMFPSCGASVEESPDADQSQATQDAEDQSGQDAQSQSGEDQSQPGQDAQGQLELDAQGQPGQDALVYTDDFDEATNLAESRFGITYQIPQNWSKQVDDSNENHVYYYPDNALMMMVAYEPMEKEGLAISELEAESFAQGLEEGFDEFTRLETTRMTLPYDGRDLIYYEYQGSIVGFQGRYYVYAFMVEDGIITFMYGNSANSNVSGEHDLWKVIESVEVNA